MDSINNNDNTNTNTMNSKATKNTNNNNNGISMTECVTNKPSCKRAGEPNPLLYKAAARNLREYHGVPSMTAGGLEKTMVLLQLRPGRLVAQGLAPKQLHEGKPAADDADANNTDSSSSSSSSSSESKVEPEQADNNQVSDDSNSNSSDGSDTDHDNIAIQDSIGIEAGASKQHPIHAVFVAAGVQLRPRETRPLLRALGVGSHRLVKLGLVKREELRRSRPGGRRGGPPHQQPGRPGGRGHHHHRGGGGMGRPRGPLPHGPPPHRHGHGHGHGRRPAHGDHRRSSSPTHGPPRGPFEEYGGLHLHHRPGHHHRGPGHHHHHHGGESEGEEEMAMMQAGPRGPPRGMPPPPHLRGQQGGPRRHGMSMHDRQTHPFHGGRSFHGEGVHSSGGELEVGLGMHRGPAHRAHPRRHPEHHGMHHLDSDGDAAGIDMDHGPVPHRAGRHHHRSSVGLHQRQHGPPPGPPGVRGGMRCEDFGDDFHSRQQHHQRHQQHQQHGMMAAGPARVHPCHERLSPSPMMPMQAC